MSRRGIVKNSYIPAIRWHNAKLSLTSETRRTEYQDGYKCWINALSKAL